VTPIFLTTGSPLQQALCKNWASKENQGERKHGYLAGALYYHNQ